MTDARGHRWWFESGGLVVDFAYTGTDELAGWLGEQVSRTRRGRSASASSLDALALRDAISNGLLERSEGRPPSGRADIDSINLYAATPDIPPSLGGGTRQAGRSSARTGQALSELARQAVELFAERERDRIRECAADDCEIVFYDDSRFGNRRWCSMQRCGNRAKVRKHRGPPSRGRLRGPASRGRRPGVLPANCVDRG